MICVCVCVWGFITWENLNVRHAQRVIFSSLHKSLPIHVWYATPKWTKGKRKIREPKVSASNNTFFLKTIKHTHILCEPKNADQLTGIYDIHLSSRYFEVGPELVNALLCSSVCVCVCARKRSQELTQSRADSQDKFPGQLSRNAQVHGNTYIVP